MSNIFCHTFSRASFLCTVFLRQSQKNFDANSEFADAWKKDNDAGGNSDAPRPVVGDQGPAFGGYITKITNDDREKEMENNVTEVAGMIGNLRNMACDMGNEIGNQNKALGRINLKAQSNSARVGLANQRATKLLKA